jgi:hypothetical protein
VREDAVGVRGKLSRIDGDAEERRAGNKKGKQEETELNPQLEAVRGEQVTEKRWKVLYGEDVWRKLGRLFSSSTNISMMQPKFFSSTGRISARVPGGDGDDWPIRGLCDKATTLVRESSAPPPLMHSSPRLWDEEK